VKPSYRYHVISHAHWDREWYQEFQGFRQRLVFQLDALLDVLKKHKRYRCFHLDGQTSVVRDYLDLRPERRDELARQLRAGRIMIGPWFVMSDEFLASGESLVRNLITGDRHCREFGVAPTPIGYVTDNFGHCSQLPQLIRSIGLRAAILHYGTSGVDEKTEMVWEGADGSEVLLVKIHVATSYMDFSAYTRWPDRMKDRPQYLLDKKALATTPVLYGMDGSDHAPARPDTLERIAMIAGENPDIDFVHSTMAEYLADLFRAMGPDWTSGRIRFQGELRTTSRKGAWNALHTGTGSSRVPMKQANDQVEWLLYRAAEPLEAWSVLLGEPDQRAFLHEAIRYLLLTHPHDSIVGCSVDQAHRDMMYRFDQAREITWNSIRESVQDLGARVDTAAFGAERQVATIINTSAHAAGPVALFELELPSELHARNAGRSLVLVDRAGGRVPVQITSHRRRVRTERFVEKRGEGPTSYVTGPTADVPMERLTIAAVCTLPPLGYRTWALDFVDAGDAPVLPPELAPVMADAKARTLENAHLQVRIGEDGRFDLLHRATGRWYRGLHQLEDMGDSGHGWSYWEPKTDRTILSTDAASRGPVEVTMHADGPLRARATIRYVLRVPSDLEPDEVERSISGGTYRSATLVDLPIEIELALTAGSPRLELRTTIRNTAKCHRVRAILPTGLACVRWLRDTPFDVTERDVTLMDTTGWQERAREHHPFKNVVAAFDGAEGLAVMTRGLCEGCVQDKPDRPIALTLYRSFREELRFHRTQDSQLLGELVLEYAFLPFRGEGGKLPEALFAQLDDYKAPRLFYVAPAHAGPLPSEGSLLQVDGPVVLSALKSAEDGRAVIVRLFNPRSEPVQATIAPGFAYRAARLANVLERPARERLKPAAGGRLRLRLGPKQILTVRFDGARLERAAPKRRGRRG
jgi:alpha-mannosidase/mannosylglycerate hydrolase